MMAPFILEFGKQHQTGCTNQASSYRYLGRRPSVVVAISWHDQSSEDGFDSKLASGLEIKTVRFVKGLSLPNY